MIHTEIDQIIYELVGDALHLEGVIPVSACITNKDSEYTFISCIYAYETWELLTNEKRMLTPRDDISRAIPLKVKLKDEDIPSTIRTPVIVVSAELEELKNIAQGLWGLGSYKEMLEALSGYMYQPELVDELRTIVGNSVGKDLASRFYECFFFYGPHKIEQYASAAVQISMLYQFGPEALRNGMLCDPKAVQDCLLRDFGIEDMMKKHYPVEYFLKILEEIVEEYEIEELTKTGYEKYQLDKVIAQFRARLI